MKVRFTDPAEFCQELEKDAPDIERQILRCTIRYEQSRLSPMIRHIVALAFYSIKGQIVQLERYCGDIWQINKEDDAKVLDRADGHLNNVKEACHKLGLEVRAGSLEE